MAEITLGLVGASNMAMTWMLPALQTAGVAVRGLYDNEPHRFGYWADSGVGGQTTNLDQLLSSDVDATHDSFTVAGPKTTMEILGDEGAIVITDAMTQVTDGSVFLHASDRVEPVKVDTSRSLYLTLLEAFVAAIRGDGRPTVTGEEGRARARGRDRGRPCCGDRPHRRSA